MDRIRDSQKDDWRRRAPSMAAGRDELLRVAEESTSSTDAEEVLDHDDGDDDDVPADDVPDEPAPDGQVQDFFLNVQQVDEHVCQVDEAVVDEPMTPITVCRSVFLSFSDVARTYSIEENPIPQYFEPLQ